MGEAAAEIVTLTRSTHRFATLPPRSRPPSRPRPAVPTSEFLLRTPARPPRPSTAGSCSAPSSSSRTSRRRRRSSPSAATLAPSAVLRKVRTILQYRRHAVTGDIGHFEKWWRRRISTSDGRCKELGCTRSQHASTECHLGVQIVEQLTAVIADEHQADRNMMYRQAVGCLPCPLARQVRRVPPATPEERRVQRRCQGSRHQRPGRQAHPSQPGPQAAPTNLPCPRSCMSDPTPHRRRPRCQPTGTHVLTLAI